MYIDVVVGSTRATRTTRSHCQTITKSTTIYDGAINTKPYASYEQLRATGQCNISNALEYTVYTTPTIGMGSWLGKSSSVHPLHRPHEGGRLDPSSGEGLRYALVYEPWEGSIRLSVVDKICIKLVGGIPLLPHKAKHYHLAWIQGEV